MTKLAIALVLGALAVQPATSATILARCGPSKGQSYYFEMGVVGPGQGGWKNDGFDDGRITALINDNNEIDLFLRDSNGLKSYLKEGYKVSLVTLEQKDRSFLLAAYGSNFAENFIFKTNEFGVGTVAWTASKVTPLVTRISVMTAECGPKYSLAP